MTESVFFLPGNSTDLGYCNVRDGQHSPLIEGREFTEALWQQYRGFEDHHFRTDAQAHFLERFWEMYLAVAFMNRGLNPSPGIGKGPEFSFLAGPTKVWVEAVAPGPGTGDDRVPETELGVAYKVPTAKILLHFASALAEKRARYQAAVSRTTVSETDGYVLAINSRRIPHAPYGNTLPYFVQALLPFGDLTVTLNRTTRAIEDSFYSPREQVAKANAATVSMQPLLGAEYSFVSAVLHSAVDCVNRPADLGGDFAVLHNPGATHPIPPSTFFWCDQYFFHEGVLEKQLANIGLQPTAANASTWSRRG